MHDSRGEWLHEMAVQDSKGVICERLWHKMAGEMAAIDGGKKE